ncbi:MAG: 50S ribosomal protein L30 [Bdellovibrionaceae bacterium]|nr:50S ribosomal protein L30 [Pseudobdellovibrionaceae bacterium]|tara:strand:+ start:41684 stop:41869 length:186 start_codon:yes stop_codon:yes gene_type:complete
MAKAFKVKLKRSLIGKTQRQKDAVRCLGLKKIGDEKVVADNPANRGQIFKVQHMLDVQVEK